jgi:hypothetical protein
LKIVIIIYYIVFIYIKDDEEFDELIMDNEKYFKYYQMINEKELNFFAKLA